MSGQATSLRYARTYPRVADSSSSFLEEGATATKVPQRWTAQETQARIAAAPPFRFGRPDEATLDEQARGYEHITRDPVRRPAKRNYVASCYRVHGDEFLPLVQRLYASTGTATNLLGTIRCLSPSEAAHLLSKPAADDALDDQPAPGTGDPDEALPGLTYPADDRPPFDPTSTRRDDRRPSNPDAAGFFTDAELGARPRPSPTAEALSR